MERLHKSCKVVVKWPLDGTSFPKRKFNIDISYAIWVWKKDVWVWHVQQTRPVYSKNSHRSAILFVYHSDLAAW